MAPKRTRRVSFSAPEGDGKKDGATRPSQEEDGTLDEITPVGVSTTLKRSRDVSIEEAPDNSTRDEHSLFTEDSAGEGLTAFNMKDELAEGDQLSKEDGVIPKALADLAVDKSPSVSSSSEDEGTAHPRETDKQKARERKAAADDGEWSDEEPGTGVERGSSPKRARVAPREWVLEDAICQLATRLREEETPAGLVRRCGWAKDVSGMGEATDLCQQLVEGGIPDVYETRREALLAKCGEWKLKWEKQGDGEVHGPFDAGQMRAWGKAGYFSQTENKAKVRVEGGQWWAAEEVFPRPDTVAGPVSAIGSK